MNLMPVINKEQDSNSRLSVDYDDLINQITDSYGYTNAYGRIEEETYEHNQKRNNRQSENNLSEML